MNWKDYPQLFANGKFKYRCNHHAEEGKTLTDYNYAIRKFIEHEVYEFKLIARPISDISDEELNDCEDIWHDIVYGALENKDRHISAKDAIKSVSDEYTRVLLHLLSIGVYPFNDDTDVIWRYENE